MIKGEIFLLFLSRIYKNRKVAKARLLKIKTKNETKKQSKVLDKEPPTQKQFKASNELKSDLLILIAS